MDVVYPLKRSAGPYRELRFSLRSLRNLPHSNVYLVGGCPPWVRNVRHLEAEQQPTKWLDSSNNIRVACMLDEVSDPFILMNDDFFVMEPVDSVPVLNRGSVLDVAQECRENGITTGAYIGGMHATRNELIRLGFDDPLSFELHVPMVIHKREFLGARELGSRIDPGHVRTAYGALLGWTSERVTDVKVHDVQSSVMTHLPFASTSDRSFISGRAGHQIRSRHAEPSEYELPTLGVSDDDNS